MAGAEREAPVRLSQFMSRIFQKRKTNKEQRNDTDSPRVGAHFVAALLKAMSIYQRISSQQTDCRGARGSFY